MVNLFFGTTMYIYYAPRLLKTCSYCCNLLIHLFLAVGTVIYLYNEINVAMPVPQYTAKSGMKEFRIMKKQLV